MIKDFNISFIIILFFIMFIVLFYFFRKNKKLTSNKIKSNDIENFNYDDKEIIRYTKINNIFSKIKNFFIEDFQINLKCKLDKDIIKLLEKNFNYITNCSLRKILQVYKNDYDFILKEVETFQKVIEFSITKGIDLNVCVHENQIQSVYYILNNLKISKNNDTQYNKLIEKIILYVIKNKIKFGYKKCDYLKFCEFDIEEIKTLNNFVM